MPTRKQPAALPFEVDPVGSTGPGPIYQGVCRQIRHLFPASDPKAKERKDALAGTIAQARSLAASIDRDSGHGGGRQANGVPLATMHAQLDALLERLSGRDQVDPFQELLEELNNTPGQETDGDRTAEAPHPAE